MPHPPPDPGSATTFDRVSAALRALKLWAGDPSYTAIVSRVNRTWRAAGRPRSEEAKRATVADCFKPGRHRLNTDLVLAIVRALHDEPGYAARWRQALRVVGGSHVAARCCRTIPGRARS